MAAGSIHATKLPAERILVETGRALRRCLRKPFEVPGKVTRVFKHYAVDLYFPANRMSVAERLLCAPPLLWIEYLVYRVDSVAEGAKDVDLDVVRNDDYDTLQRYRAKFENLLRSIHAYNPAVAREIENGWRYVRLENKVTSNRVIDHADVMRLAELRPTDVRLLHGMTFSLRGQACDEALLNLLWPVEVLADIGDDLSDYRRDVISGHFNTYAAFVELYGDAARERMRGEIARYERMFLDRLAQVPHARQDELRALCTRRYRKLTEAIPDAIPPNPEKAL